jgi:hypothetical protein
MRQAIKTLTSRRFNPRRLVVLTCAFGYTNFGERKIHIPGPIQESPVTKTKIDISNIYTREDEQCVRELFKRDFVCVKEIGDELFLDNSMAEIEIINTIKSNSAFSTVFIEKMLDGTITPNQLKIIEDAKILHALCSRMDENEKNKFIDAILKRPIPLFGDHYPMAKTVKILCENIIYSGDETFRKKFITRIIETNNYGALAMFKYTTMFTYISPYLREQLIKFLFINITEVSPHIVVDGIEHDADFNDIFKIYAMKLLTENKLHTLHDTVFNALISKNKEDGNNFVNYTIDNKTFEKFSFDDVEIMYKCLTDETKNKVYDYIVQNYKRFDSKFIMKSIKYNPLLIDKCLQHIMRTKDYGLLHMFAGDKQYTIFNDESKIYREFIDFMFKNKHDVPGLIVFGGIKKSIYFTEKYIDVIVDNDIYVEFEVLMDDIKYLFKNAGKNEDKLINFIIKNVDNITPEVLMRAIKSSQKFTKNFVDLMINSDKKFLLDITPDIIPYIWSCISTESHVSTPCELQIKIEGIIYRDLELLTTEQLMALCMCWNILWDPVLAHLNGLTKDDIHQTNRTFVHACISKLEQTDKIKAALCKKIIS